MDLMQMSDLLPNNYEKSTSTPPELGLVCITTSDKVRYRALTRKRLLQLPTAEQEQVLRELYTDNLQRLNAAIDFCKENNIRLYRIPSGLFPFADTEQGEAILDEFKEQIKATGDRVRLSGIRLVVHPDQFVVLSSDTPSVIENSIKILQMHARNMDLLGMPRSPWAMMEIHGGKGDRAERLINVIRDLPDEIRSRLALENDEYAYSAAEILAVCREAGVPMVFDAHHHVIHEKLDTYEDASIAEILAAARTTWPVPEWQLVHISNGREEFGDPHHSDFITAMPSSYRDAPWIEVEAKLKEDAIAKLREIWTPVFGTAPAPKPTEDKPIDETPQKTKQKKRSLKKVEQSEEQPQKTKQKKQPAKKVAKNNSELLSANLSGE
ncbi:UV DNA damage repair endonuclease UvsE [Trichocoleus sp. FACHB-69]|uniref:UV DNA damage repair endonuclease UvsE n=1 Tax=Trichocoleus sp. FACHB-69 TaxID=2692874 RepID=UPI001685D43A|nr:UV DNA damage repair endonuclease UvsE [Trichocoleus sp. FACHB-69]MBD1930849.1 UV DNA damage repair endonuclease UvsE [Trichocoleus sp. FACHB-69]